MRLSIVAVSLVLAAACGRIESDPDASDLPIDAPSGGIDGATTDATSIDAPMIPVDAAIDATPIDAPPPTAPFDIAYTNRWTITNTTGVGAGWIGLIVNKSTTGQSMDLNTLQVVSFTDDHPNINFSFMILNAATYVLPAQQAGGMMSSGAAAVVDPLVSETRFNTSRPTFDFTLNMIPQPIDVTVNASAVVRHGNQQATLTFQFLIQSSGSSGATITGAGRVSSVFTP